MQGGVQGALNCANPDGLKAIGLSQNATRAAAPSLDTPECRGPDCAMGVVARATVWPPLRAPPAFGPYLLQSQYNAVRRPGFRSVRPQKWPLWTDRHETASCLRVKLRSPRPGAQRVCELRSLSCGLRSEREDEGSHKAHTAAARGRGAAKKHVFITVRRAG